MAILLHADSRILVQGITGSEGAFHTVRMLEYGTRVVAGVTPGKGGIRTTVRNVPVFDTVREAVDAGGADVSCIFVPPRFAADAVLEAADAGIGLIVCITEGIPVRDMLTVKKHLAGTACRLIGPNCPGIITPGEAKAGIIPGPICTPGRTGIVSKSGTLTYEAIAGLEAAGLGQSTAIGIGGDPVIGSSMTELLALFEADENTDAVVLIGEIGGRMEIEAAEFVRDNCSKPVAGFIAGQTAPPGRRMGHAGAVISGGEETAEAKIRKMKDCGIAVCSTPAEIGMTIKNCLEK